ncbi:PTS glucitol/sorbitol transporter subunit IIA, partial [Bacillus sp. JCM 19041]
MIYRTTVTKMGPSAGDFLEEKMIILFKDNAPEELAEFCV